MPGYLLNNIYDILDHLKIRRAIFLGNGHTFQSLDSFINGYSMAARGDQCRKAGATDFSYFNTWLLGHLKKHFGAAGGWHWQISNRNPGNDEKAFEEFFHYLEVFKKSKTKARVMVLNEDALKFNKNSGIERSQVIVDDDGNLQTIPAPATTRIRWVTIEHSKTVWLEYLDKDDHIVYEEWHLKAKKADEALAEGFGVLTDEWIQVVDGV